MLKFVLLSVVFAALAPEYDASSCVCGDTEGREGDSLQWVSWRYTLKITDRNGNEYKCSADLITDKHLLTSKDCITGMEKIILLKNVDGRDQDAIPIKTIHYFEDRIPPYNTGVIAVVEMVKPVTLDAKHGTVCAPGLSW